MTEIINEQAVRLVWDEVAEILGGDDSGHGLDHVRRVYNNAMRFANEFSEPVDLCVVGLSAQLHDVDDYKLVGRKQAELQSNATRIMSRVGLGSSVQDDVRSVIANMGYSRALRGVRPRTIEGMIVSDADMCDAIGASGVIRALTYAVSSKGSRVVFDRNVRPQEDITADEYNGGGGTTHDTDSFINHFFEKLLKLKGLMMTEPGRTEAVVRDEQMVTFLRAFFREEGEYEWLEYLSRYLEARN